MPLPVTKIKEWLDRALALKGTSEEKTHVMIVVDSFDFHHYPVFVNKNQEVKAVYDDFNNREMQRVMEVYDLNEDIDKQLAQEIVLNF